MIRYLEAGTCESCSTFKHVLWASRAHVSLYNILHTKKVKNLYICWAQLLQNHYIYTDNLWINKQILKMRKECINGGSGTATHSSLENAAWELDTTSNSNSQCPKDTIATLSTCAYSQYIKDTLLPQVPRQQPNTLKIQSPLYVLAERVNKAFKRVYLNAFYKCQA